MKRGAAWLVALLGAACLEAPPSSGSDPPVPCGTTGAVRDAFDEESPEWQRQGSWSLEGGRVQLYAAPAEAASMSSTFAYQLAGSELTMQLRVIGPGDGEVYMLLVDQEDDVVGLELAAGNLSLIQQANGSDVTADSIVFEPDMVWWRLREAGGRLAWATSTDGERWQEHGDVQLEVMGPVWVLVEISAGEAQAVVEIESFRPSGDEGLCPASSFVDDFDAPSRRWLDTAPWGCAITAGGALEIGYDDSEVCGLGTAEHFDLRGSAVAVEAVEARGCDPTSYFTLELPDLAAEFECADDGSGPVLRAQLNGDGGPGELGSVDFDPASHRFWQIRHDPVGRRLLFETRAEASEWVTIGVAPVEDDAVRGASIGLYVSDESPGDLGGPVVFDRLNLVP